VSPTVFREGGFRAFFFFREEARVRVHAQSAQGEAKFWIEPKIELAASLGVPDHEIAKILNLIREREDEIREAWNRHFGS
jgi:uncharacterized protein DUF4160